MTLPYTKSQSIFAAAVLTATRELDHEFELCITKVFEIVTTGFSGTIDIQGKVDDDATYDNLAYYRLGQDGPQQLVNDQLSYTTDTGRYRYCVPEYYKLIQVVMTRTAGSVTMDVAGIDAPLAIPMRSDTPLTYSAPAAHNVTTTSSAIVAANTSRRVLAIVNDSDTPIWLGIGDTAVINTGIRLNAGGGSAQFGGDGGLPLTLQAVNGIHAGAGNKVATVQEAT